MKKLNICVVIDNIFPSHGGIGKTTERFSEILKKRGHNVVFISSRDKDNRKSFERVNGFKVYRLLGVKVPFTGGIYYQAFPSIPKVNKILEKEKIDAILLVSYTLLGLCIQRCGKGLRIPVVLALHFQPENVTKHVHLDYAPFRKIFSLWTKFICYRSDSVIVPSKFAKNMLLDYGVKGEINVVSNGINLEDFNINKVDEKLFKKEFKLEGKKVFLFVGRLMPEKNLKLLIEAASFIDWKKNKDLKIVIVGDGDERNKLIRKVKTLGLENNVVFTGKISHEMLKSAYKACDVFILPSLVELEGIVLLEAMAFGKPIMVANSDSSAAPNLVYEDKNGHTFCPVSPEALAKKMIYLAENERKIDEMGRNSFEIIKGYDINKSVDKMESILVSKSSV